MNFHSNTTRCEFIKWLRYAAIDGGMSAPFIDCIDTLDRIEYMEAELEAKVEELEQTEKDRDDLRSELEDLRNAVQEQSDSDPASMSENLLAALKWSNKALERHT